MYLLTAIFNQSCLNDVLTDLKERGIEGITISNVLGKGGLGYKKENGETKLDTNIRLDIVLSNETYKEIAKEAIRTNTRDLITGSGKMWVTPVLEVERIRTGEVNEAALAHPSLSKKSGVPDENYYTAIDTPVS
jgi:nitrogen regulatory protein P-II 1